jgi:hypothetical protein
MMRLKKLAFFACAVVIISLFLGEGQLHTQAQKGNMPVLAAPTATGFPTVTKMRILNPVPLVNNEWIQFLVMVTTPSGQPVTSGHVQLVINNSYGFVAALDSLLNSSGQAIFSTGVYTNNSSTWSYYAQFLGSGVNFPSATKPFQVNAVPASTTILLWTPVNAVMRGGRVTFTVTVSAPVPSLGFDLSEIYNNSNATEPVYILYAGRVVATVQVDRMGHGTGTVTVPSFLGTVDYVASYSGDIGYNPSTSNTVSLDIVGKFPG